MKFFYIIILLLAVLSGWLYLGNQEKLKKYTDIKSKHKTLKKTSSIQVKTVNQTNFDIPTAPSVLNDGQDDSLNVNLVNDLNSSTVSNFSDEDYSSYSNIGDDYQEYTNSNDSNSPMNKKPRGTRYSNRAAYYRDLSNKGIDVSVMNVGPDEFYVSNEESVIEPDTSRSPAEE